MAGIVKMFYSLIRRFFDIQTFFSADNDKHMSLRQKCKQRQKDSPILSQIHAKFWS